MLERVDKPSRLVAPRDRLSRPLTDLRLSVIDRCNFRCSYCMPESSLTGKNHFLAKQDLLSDEDFVRLASAFTALGVTKVRLTGGEPLLRPGFAELVEALSRMPAIEDLSMTSNGLLLPRLASRLRQAGLKRITVSLDSLDQAVFARMSGGRGSVTQVLKGVEAAERAGFPGLKINCVVQRGVNDHTVLDLVSHFRGSPHVVRLIEFLDVGRSNGWAGHRVVPGNEWLKRIHSRWPIRPLPRTQAGETAQRYAFEDGRGEIGLINSITQPFCSHCSRARVTADGMLHTCLFNGHGIALKPILDAADSTLSLERSIRRAWTTRIDRYSELRSLRPPESGKQEMYRMGG